MKKRNSIAYEEHEINIYHHHHHRMKKKERSKNERHSPKKVQKISDIFLAPPPSPLKKFNFLIKSRTSSSARPSTPNPTSADRP